MSDHEKHEGEHGEGESHESHKSHGPHGHGAHEEHEEGWIVSFADNCLLQMGFFVILLALNMQKPSAGGIGGEAENGGSPVVSASMLDAVISIREAFNSPVDLGSTNPGDQPLIRRIRERGSTGESHLPGPDGEHHDTQTVRPSDYHNIGGLVPFDERSAEISAQGLRTIEQVAEQIRGTRWVVEVRGHASRAEVYESEAEGRRLCFDRAYAVGEALAEALSRGGGDRRRAWDQVRVVAAGAGDPARARPATTGERIENQRVEIIVTDEAMPADPFTK